MLASIYCIFFYVFFCTVQVNQTRKRYDEWDELVPQCHNVDFIDLTQKGGVDDDEKRWQTADPYSEYMIIKSVLKRLDKA